MNKQKSNKRKHFFAFKVPAFGKCKKSTPIMICKMRHKDNYLKIINEFLQYKTKPQNINETTTTLQNIKNNLLSKKYNKSMIIFHPCLYKYTELRKKIK